MLGANTAISRGLCRYHANVKKITKIVSIGVTKTSWTWKRDEFKKNTYIICKRDMIYVTIFGNICLVESLLSAIFVAYKCSTISITRNMRCVTISEG